MVFHWSLSDSKSSQVCRTLLSILAVINNFVVWMVSTRPPTSNYLLVWLNLYFLHISKWITRPTQSCLALYSLCANLLHSLIMWLMVSSLSPHSLHLLFCWVLYILALICLVLTALSCAASRRDSVSLLKFPFLRHVQVLSCEMLFINRLNRP